MTIGGQAVIQGVMMRSENRMSIAVRSGRKIIVKRKRLNPIGKRIPLLKLPVLRGFVALIETLVTGMEALEYSANLASPDEKLSRKELIITLLIALGFVVVFFIALPFLIASFLKLKGAWFALFDGLLRMLFFIAYVIAISFFSEVKMLFQYHGAEHKVVHAYEAGKKLSYKSAKPYSTLHPRCGTSFIMIVFAISIITFSLLTGKAWQVQLLSRIMLIPLIAGLSYELLKLSARFENMLIFKVVIAPGLFFQMITTKEPTEKQTEVAIAALKALIK